MATIMSNKYMFILLKLWVARKEITRLMGGTVENKTVQVSV
jgi:hypothetical protein